jgi:hypothetical protein
MNTSEHSAEANIVTRKMPQDNLEVSADLQRLISDPVAYIAENREESLRDARLYVDSRLDEMLATEKNLRPLHIGRRVLTWFVG